MKATLIIVILSCLFSCHKEIKISVGDYSGSALVLHPFPTPDDSVFTAITLNLKNGRFLGTSDTSRSPFSTVVGSGTYGMSGNSINFKQDSLNFANIGDRHYLLTGEYNLLKNGDSLVFFYVPSAVVHSGARFWLKAR